MRPRFHLRHPGGELRPRVQIGRIAIYLWAGSWSWWESIPCPGHCKNLYVGPFGFEYELKEEEEGPPCGDYCPGECGWNPDDPEDPCQPKEEA